LITIYLIFTLNSDVSLFNLGISPHHTQRGIVTKLKNIRFDPKSEDGTDLLQQIEKFKGIMKDPMLDAGSERAAEAWTKADLLVDQLEEVRAKAGQKANTQGKNIPCSLQNPKIFWRYDPEIIGYFVA
jgi:hypothetical protein